MLIISLSVTMIKRTIWLIMRMHIYHQLMPTFREGLRLWCIALDSPSKYNRMEVRTAEKVTLFDDFYLCPQASLMWMIKPKSGTMLGIMYQSTVSDMPYSVINGYRKYSTPFPIHNWKSVPRHSERTWGDGSFCIKTDISLPCLCTVGRLILFIMIMV